MCNSRNLRCWTTCFNFNFTVQESGSFSTMRSSNTRETTEGKADFLHYSFSSLIVSFPHVFVNRISVRVRGGEAQGPAAGLSGMNPGLIRDLGAAFFESHCEFNDKTSSPFSSNRTMFETEEVCWHTQKHDTSQFINHLSHPCSSSPHLSSLCVLDGDSSRPRGDASVSGAVCRSVSVCCGHQHATSLYPAPQQTGLPEHL